MENQGRFELTIYGFADRPIAILGTDSYLEVSTGFEPVTLSSVDLRSCPLNYETIWWEMMDSNHMPQRERSYNPPQDHPALLAPPIRNEHRGNHRTATS